MGMVLIVEQLECSEKGAAIPLDYAVGGNGVDVEMEAPISTDDLIRAGGFGAGDGLNSVMPTSMDGTDLEGSLIEAYEYEGKEDDGASRPLHPGLGATSQHS